MTEELINRKSLQDLIKEVVLEMKPELEHKLYGRTLTIDEFRKAYCGNKGAEWVRTFIFDKFDDEVNYANGGWVLNPRKSRNGRTAIIFEDQAAEWLAKNRRRIDWNARLKK